MRTLVGGRFVYGSLLLVAPEVLLGRVARGPIDRRTRLVARTLGARNLGEATLLAGRWSRGRLLACAAIDGTHAATMVALAALDTHRRPLALASALTAASLATASVAAVGRLGNDPG